MAWQTFFQIKWEIKRTGFWLAGEWEAVKKVLVKFFNDHDRSFKISVAILFAADILADFNPPNLSFMKKIFVLARVDLLFQLVPGIEIGGRICGQNWKD